MTASWSYLVSLTGVESRFKGEMLFRMGNPIHIRHFRLHLLFRLIYLTLC